MNNQTRYTCTVLANSNLESDTKLQMRSFLVQACTQLQLCVAQSHTTIKLVGLALKLHTCCKDHEHRRFLVQACTQLQLCVAQSHTTIKLVKLALKLHTRHKDHEHRRFLV